MAITTESQTPNLVATKIAGTSQKVYSSGASTALASPTNKLVTAPISMAATKITGKKILVGIEKNTVFSTNGTASSGASASFSFSDSKTSLESSLSPTPSIVINGRTAVRDLSGEVASMTFTFSGAANIGDTISLTSAPLDKTGATTNRVYEGAAEGWSNGSTTSSGNIGFAVQNSGDSTDDDKKYSSAANLAEAIGSNYGHGLDNKLLTAPNVASESDSTETKGKMTIYQSVPGVSANSYGISVSETAANATLMVASDSFGTSTIILTNADSTTHTLTAAALGVGNGSSSTQINTDDISDAESGATQLKESIDAAITAGDLDFTCGDITNDSDSDATVVTITSTTTGSTGNQDITGTLVSGDVVIINNTTAGGDHGTTEGTIGGSNFVEACSVNPPASWSGGVDPTDDFTSALVNMGHSPRWAAYNFMEWVNDSDNGPENVTATQGLGAAANQVRMTTTTTGIDNNYDITYNSSMPSILSVLPPSTFSGGQDSHLPKLGYSLSLDGINWTEPVNIIDNVKADELGIILVELELPTLSPFLRLEFNPTGANLGSTSGSVIFKHTGG